MEIFMDIIGNQLIQVVGGALAGVFVGGIATWVYVQSGLSKLIADPNNGKKLGNKIGLFVHDNLISKIKDTNLRNKLMDDLDTAGNEVDYGWSLGVKGISV
jgi:hypothetical protein